ncbi:MAG: hypothetical protein OHK0039_13280 [Bacteroidia bacterium]
MNDYFLLRFRSDMLHFILLQLRLADGGPVYAETDTSHLIAEPWNGASALLFLFIVAYWVWLLRGRYRRHLFLTLVQSVLAIGGIGGTLYHAFRVSQVFLVMDWLPILLICLASSVYFFIRAWGRWLPALAVIVGMVLLQGVLFRSGWIPMRLAINVNYAMMGLMVLVPVVLLLVRTRFVAGQWVGIALLSFVAALFFRLADGWGWLPMGTHFLWHVFGAVACHSMFRYVYLLNEAEAAAGVAAA